MSSLSNFKNISGAEILNALPDALKGRIEDFDDLRRSEQRIRIILDESQFDFSELREKPDPYESTAEERWNWEEVRNSIVTREYSTFAKEIEKILAVRVYLPESDFQEQGEYGHTGRWYSAQLKMYICSDETAALDELGL